MDTICTLYERLRVMRNDYASEREMRPFQVMTNETLLEVVMAKPVNKQQLGRIKGIVRKYIDDIATLMIPEIQASKETSSGGSRDRNQGNRVLGVFEDSHRICHEESCRSGDKCNADRVQMEFRMRLFFGQQFNQRYVLPIGRPIGRKHLPFPSPISVPSFLQQGHGGRTEKRNSYQGTLSRFRAKSLDEQHLH